MTISTTSSSITYTGNGVTTVFAYDFIIPEAEDAYIYVYDNTLDTTTVLDPADYTITGLGDDAGGTVTYNPGTPIASTKTITIQRIMTLDQETDLENQGGYYPAVVEAALDKLTMLCQQLQTQVTNCLAFPIGATTDVDDLIADILAGAANAASAAASAAAAAASAASIAALLPLATANIADLAITNAKLGNTSVTINKLGSTAVPNGVILINGQITESHSSNAVTFAIKTNAGTDPSAASPVYVVWRNESAGSSQPSIGSITSAMSLTISSGSTLGFANATPGRVWLVIFNDSGTFRLGAINCYSSTSIYPLGAQAIASSTAEGGAGAADSAHVFYTGTAVSAKAYAVIGYCTWESGLTTAGTWDTSPTRMQVVNLSTPLPGRTVQRAANTTGAQTTGSTTIPADDTIPQITEGDQYMTQAITPSSAANLLEIEAQGFFSSSANTQQMAMALFQDATANALAVSYDGRPTLGNPAPIKISHAMLAGTTSATTLRMRAGGSAAGTTTFNGVAGSRRYGGVANSYMAIKEIMA